MMSLSIQATWSRGDIRSKLSGISKAKFKFIELSENDIIDAKEDGEAHSRPRRLKQQRSHSEKGVVLLPNKMQ